MANTNAPFGFRFSCQLDGGDPVLREYIHAAGDATALGRGDLVDITGAADTVAQAAAGGPFVGIVNNQAAASTLVTCPVLLLSTRTLVYAQEDSVGGAIAAASEGLNADVIVAAASNGISQMMIDSSTAATTATLDTRLFDIFPRVGNAQGTSAVWRVLVNDLRFGDLKAGV